MRLNPPAEGHAGVQRTMSSVNHLHGPFHRRRGSMLSALSVMTSVESPQNDGSSSAATGGGQRVRGNSGA